MIGIITPVIIVNKELQMISKECKDCAYRLPAKGCHIRSGKWEDNEYCSKWKEGKTKSVPFKERGRYL